MWKLRRAGDDLDVLLARGAARATTSPAGSDGRRRAAAGPAGRRCPSVSTVGLERHAQADLHVGGAQLDAAVGGGDLDAGERLDGAVRRRDAGDGLQLRQQIRVDVDSFTMKTSKRYRSHRGC